MKYVIYFSSANDNDSLIASCKKEFLKEIKALKDEGFSVDKVCRVIRGEYVKMEKDF